MEGISVMQKKFLVSLTATATAFSMLVAPSLTAFAEDAAAEETSTSVSNPEAGSQSSSEGSSTAFAEDAASNDNPVSYVLGKDGVKAGNYEVEEDVIRTDGGTAVTVSGEGINVTIDKNVDSSGVKEYKSGDTVTYQGATGVSVSNGANLTIKGDVTGGSRGISANDDSNITVNGDVTATGTDQTFYHWNKETQKYDIQENSASGIGVETVGDATINIGEDISAYTDGIVINPDNDDKKGSIIVEGTITAASDTGKGIQIYKVPKKYDGITFDDVKDALDDVPELTIYEIDAKYPVYVRMATADDSSQNPNPEIETAVINAINYIVKKNPESVNKYGMNVSNDTVKIGEEFTVTVDEIPEGYELNAGDNVKVTKNEDGSFTLKLENEKGGIYVQVRLIPVSNPDGSTSYVVEPTPEQFDDNNQDQAETPQSPAGAIVISNNQGAADAPSTVAAISGTKPARTASYNLGTVTPIQYKESIIANVADAPQNGAFNIQTDRVSCFDKKMIQAFASRPDIDINVVFTYGGKKLKVTIPAGYDVNKLLDDNGYCGFLRLMSILGYTEL